jgi:hypothetical protein
MENKKLIPETLCVELMRSQDSGFEVFLSLDGRESTEDEKILFSKMFEPKELYIEWNNHSLMPNNWLKMHGFKMKRRTIKESKSHSILKG